VTRDGRTPLWARALLGDLGDLYCGQSPPSAAVNSDGIGTVYVTGPEQWDGHHLHLDKWTTEPKRLAPNDSIFITVKGSGVGKVFPGKAAAIGRDIYAFGPHAELDARFVERAIVFSIEDLKRNAAGDIPGLSRSHILDHEVAVPPAGEQRRIVESLDSYVTRLDAATECLDRIQRNLKRYRASVLQAAVEGRLVPTEAEFARKEGRDYESGAALLARILKERRRRWEEFALAEMHAKGRTPKNDKWKSKYEEPVSPNSASLPRLPRGWCWASLDQLAWTSGYGTSVRCEPTSSGMPVLRIPNVANATLDLFDLKFATQDLNLVPGDEIADGDFVFIRTNGSRSLIGRATYISARPGLRNHYFASYLIRFRLALEPEIRFVGRWLSLFWQAPATRTELEAKAATSAGQYNLSMSGVAGLAVPLAPGREMLRLCDTVDDLLSVADATETSVQAQGIGIDRLRQSILKWAFEGKLVDQDPNDERADALLARIKAERAATDGVPSRRGQPSARKKDRAA
jgi:type I restriction enzyme, S subunit